MSKLTDDQSPVQANQDVIAALRLAAESCGTDYERFAKVAYLILEHAPDTPDDNRGGVDLLLALHRAARLNFEVSAVSSHKTSRSGWNCPICGRWEDGAGPCAHTGPPKEDAEVAWLREVTEPSPARGGWKPSARATSARGAIPMAGDQSPAQSVARCWWIGCKELPTNYVTAGGVIRNYCPTHTAQVERYYEAAARQMAKDEHRA